MIRAKYENGVFKPLEEVKLAEGTLVKISVPMGAQPGDTSPSETCQPSACGPTARTSLTA